MPDGATRAVASAADAAEYVERVVDTLVGFGVEAPLRALARGFDAVLPLAAMRLFSATEVSDDVSQK